MNILVRPIAERDESAWSKLFTDYRALHGATGEPEIVSNAWRWGPDPGSWTRGIQQLLEEAR